MEGIFPIPKDKSRVNFLYLVRKHACKVEKVRVKEIAPRYVRVFGWGSQRARRDSWKSLYHEYFYHYAQAKRVLEVDYELKMAALREKLRAFEDELRSIQLTREEDL